MAWKMPSILEENAKLTTLRYKNRRGACQKNLEKLTIRVTNRPSATSHPPMTFWQRSSPAHSLKRPPNKPLVPHQLRKPNLNFPSPQKPTPGKYLYPPRYSPFPHLQKPGAPPPLPPPGDNHIPQLPLLRETSLERAIVFRSQGITFRAAAHSPFSVCKKGVFVGGHEEALRYLRSQLLLEVRFQ